MKAVNFDIHSDLPISRLFLSKQISSFSEACKYIRDLPYGRNKNKNDLSSVFTDDHGTCSTKHALLKQLAAENNIDNVRLKLGIFKMNGNNTPEVSATLRKYGLDYIPEAHNYLRVGGEIVDCTKHNSSKDNFINDLINEIEIEPHQITEFKVKYHQLVLKEWLSDKPEISFSFDQLWAIREQCIADLSLM